MKSSVVIPTWKGLELLKKNLPDVMALGADEVIIVNDCSPDNTEIFLKKEFPQIKIVSHRSNMRFPRAVNDGFEFASGEIVILLNQDVNPEKNLLRYVLPHFEDPNIFAVTFNEQKRSWAKAGYKNGFIEFENGKIDEAVHDSFWASGGSAAFRKSYWDDMSGLDVNFSPGYFEDLDIGCRAWKRGLRIIWEPKALVSHASESTNKHAFEPRYLARIKDRNYLLVHWKNLDLKNIINHKLFLLQRIMNSPGFIIPFIMALIHLPRVLVFRLRERGFTKLSDEQVFAKFD